MTPETDTEIRLRRAAEALADCRDAESRLRRELASAVESTKRAKEKHETLFLQAEHESGERRKAGLEPYCIGY